jgi:hypothetical protein
MMERSVFIYKDIEMTNLQLVALYALADLIEIMPEFEPSGDRSHSGWRTIQDLASALRADGINLSDYEDDIRRLSPYNQEVKS